jgi:uncharacterized protein
MPPAPSRLESVAYARASAGGPAHDHLHVRRVVASARTIALAERADVDVSATSALLHELFNYPKDHPDSARSGDVCAQEAAALLAAEGYPAPFVDRVTYAIRVHSFTRGIVPETLEARVLQDADRLDAIGAIGIARCFATCADMKRPFYADDDPFCSSREPDDKAWGLDHFYRKLLRIPETLHTATARALAAERVVFVRAFLDQLAREVG